ncbi:MAG: DUF2188 domain-containing protein [Gemmatimonadaceae bacterium]
MKRGGGVHTVPSGEGRGWWNKVDGEVLTRHRLKEAAEATGREIAIKLGVEHSIHNSDGTIEERKSYGQA